MRKLLFALPVLALCFLTACDENDVPEVEEIKEKVYVDESLKDEIAETLTRLGEICEVNYIDTEDSSLLDEIKNGISYVLVMRNPLEAPEGMIPLFNGTLPEDVLVTFSNKLIGTLMKDAFRVGIRPDEEAMKIIEKVRNTCGESAYNSLNKTFKNICINTVDDIETHAFVLVSSYFSQNYEIRERTEGPVYVFPAAVQLNVVVLANGTCPLKFAKQVEEVFLGSYDFIDESELTLPPYANDDMVNITDNDGKQVENCVPDDEKGKTIIIH